MTVLGDTARCMGVSPMQCLQIKVGNQIEFQYSSISGFSPISGYTYRLLVRENKIENPPADGSSKEYSLVKILSKRLTTGTIDKNLIGKWNLDSYFIDDMGYVLSGYTLNMTTDSYSTQFCNLINGKYTIKNDKFISPIAISTLMACSDGTKNMLESAWDLDNANYAISTSWDNKTMLSIKTKRGSTFIFTK
jgi:heat shock protein HslJ